MSRVSLVLSKGDRDFEFIAVVEKPDYSDPGLREEITIDWDSQAAAAVIRYLTSEVGSEIV